MDSRRCGLSTPVHARPGWHVCGLEAVAALADDPYPGEGFHRGRYHRLRAGQYRIMYVIDEDMITVERVDRVAAE